MCDHCKDQNVFVCENSFVYILYSNRRHLSVDENISFYLHDDISDLFEWMKGRYLASIYQIRDSFIKKKQISLDAGHEIGGVFRGKEACCLNYTCPAEGCGGRLKKLLFQEDFVRKFRFCEKCGNKRAIQTEYELDNIWDFSLGGSGYSLFYFNRIREFESLKYCADCWDTFTEEHRMKEEEEQYEEEPTQQYYDDDDIGYYVEPDRDVCDVCDGDGPRNLDGSCHRCDY